MAENDTNTKQAAGLNGNEAPKQEGPQFALQRIYLKDASFESPRSPAAFQSSWKPKISFNINTRNTALQDDVFEVVLIATVEAKMEESVAFLAEVHQAGIFTCKGFKPEELEHVLAAVCPNIMFPYARETIDNLVTKGSFPPVMLAPVNFDALYAQSKQQKQQNQKENGAAKADPKIQDAMAATAKGHAAKGKD